MATTTNYGWTTPNDTDLVKDGAAAIRTLGSSVDTTTKNLNPETTLGDMSFRSATSNVNTRLPIGSSGQHLTVVAGVPAWATASDQTPLTTKGDLFTFSTVDARLGVGTNDHRLVAASGEATGLKYVADTQNTVIDTAGDLLYGTAADTVGKLAIGTAGQVLVVNSGATAPEWATAASGGGMTLLSTTTLSSATTTISVTGGYVDLVLHFTGIYLSGASQGLEIRYNTVSTGYNSVFLYQASGGATVENNNNQSGVGTAGSALTDANNEYLFGYMRFFDYLGTAGMKSYQGQIAARNDSETYFARTFFGANSAYPPAAITQVQFVTGAASFSAGTVKVYGVK